MATRSAVFAALALLLPHPALAADGWLEVKSDHFTVISNAKEKDARRVAEEFEQIRVIFRGSIPSAVDPPVPMVIYAVKKKSDFKDLMPELWEGRSADPAGVFRSSGIRVQVVVRMDVWGESNTVFHEYHHLYTDRAAPWTPVWLSEGLAEIWGSTVVNGRTVETGRPDRLPFGYFRAKPMLMSLEDLLAVDHQSKAYTAWDRAGTFYAESTLFTDFLILGQPEGEKKLEKFVAMVGQGVPQMEALRQSFGDPKELEEAFRVFLRSQSFSFVRSTLAEGNQTAHAMVRPLSPAEAAAYRGEVLALGRHPDLAVPLFQEALAADPHLTRALEGMALVAGRSTKAGSPSTWLARAIEQPDADFSAHFLAAVSDTSGGVAVEHELAKAVELNPEFAPALTRLAGYRVASDPDGAIQLAIKAAQLEPEEPVYFLRAAKILKRAGRPEAARFATEASMRALNIGGSFTNNEVCWSGAISGFASAVFASCETAVAKAPDNGNIRDSRGLARALTGDKAGAIEDFQFAIEHSTEMVDRDAFVASRSAWIEALKAGKNPIDAATLSKLDASDLWSLPVAAGH